MSATNKGHIKTGHKTMIYVLSLMRLLSVRRSIHPWVHPLRVHLYASMSPLPSSPPPPSPLGSSSSLFAFPLIIFLIVSLLVLLLLLLLYRPPLLYRFRRIAPSGRRWSIPSLGKSSSCVCVCVVIITTIIIYCEISRAKAASNATKAAKTASLFFAHWRHN